MIQKEISPKYIATSRGIINDIRTTFTLKKIYFLLQDIPHLTNEYICLHQTSCVYISAKIVCNVFRN